MIAPFHRAARSTRWHVCSPQAIGRLRHSLRENHPGGSGNIGTALAARRCRRLYHPRDQQHPRRQSEPVPKLGFDTRAISRRYRSSAYRRSAAGASLRSRRQREELALVKSQPGQYSYAHAGLGTPGYSPAKCSSRPSARSRGRLLQRWRASDHLDHRRAYADLYTSISTAAGHIRQGTVPRAAVTARGVRPRCRCADARGSGRAWSGIHIILGVLVPRGSPASELTSHQLAVEFHI